VTTTLIKNADWVVAWDETAGRHVYRRGIDIAFADDRIVFVGRDYPAPADHVVDGADRLVLPGLIHPLASRARAALSRRARGARPAQHAHDRAVRALAGILGTG
jgi:N-acyl-D-aspartate/D-glutamate deacylase